MGVHAQRHPEVGADPRGDAALELVRGDPHDRVGSAVEADLLAEHVRVPVVAGAPVPVRDHHHGVGPRRGILFGEEGSTQLGLDPVNGEVVALHHLPHDQFGAAVELEVRGVLRRGGHRRERLVGALVQELPHPVVGVEELSVPGHGVDVHHRGRVLHAPLRQEE